MAENDIYDSKIKYEKLAAGIGKYLNPPEGMRQFQMKYAGNLEHFRRLFQTLEARDTSYKRRLRLCTTLLGVCHVLEKDLKKATRDDIDRVMSWAHERNKTPVSKECFIRQLKFLWKLLFPEADLKGRPDDTVVPYQVRHLRTVSRRMRHLACKFTDEFVRIR